MTTWFDIEPVLDRLEQLDKATLESFACVMPPPSQNPSFHHRFEQAQQRIRRRLDQIAAEEARAQVALEKERHVNGDEKWYKKPVGIIVLAVAGGLLVALIKYVFGL